MLRKCGGADGGAMGYWRARHGVPLRISAMQRSWQAGAQQAAPLRRRRQRQGLLSRRAAGATRVRGAQARLPACGGQGGWHTLPHHPNESVEFTGATSLRFLKGAGLDVECRTYGAPRFFCVASQRFRAGLTYSAPTVLVREAGRNSNPIFTRGKRCGRVANPSTPPQLMQLNFRVAGGPPVVKIRASLS